MACFCIVPRRIVLPSFLTLAALTALSGCSADTEPAAPALPEPIVSQTAAPSRPAPEIQEFYNENGICITATGIAEGFFGPEITVQIHNSTSRNISIASRGTSVNGYMMELAGLYADVAAGKNVTKAISLYQTELDQAGIQTLSQVEFFLRIRDSDRHTTLADSPLLCVSFPAGEEFCQQIQDAGREIYNQGGIRVVSQGEEKPVLFLENNSEAPVTIHTENLSVNGLSVSDAMWCSLRPGTRAVEPMAVPVPDPVETLEFTLRIVHGDTWEELATTGTITLHFTPS